MRTFLITLFLLAELGLQAQSIKPVNLILDTDIGPDYDDVGAMAVMHALADSGQVNILATMASNKVETIGPVLSVLNTWFGRPDIPIGVVKGKGVQLKAWQKWDSILVADYPHRLRSNEEAEDAVTLYRRILAAQPDHSVTICTIGFFTNIANLLRSAPDKFSPLNGTQLVEQKVLQLVSMAGRFPSGSEFNVNQDAASSQYVAEHCPVKFLLSGFEIGWEVRTGLALSRSAGPRTPVRDVFARCIPLDKQDSLGRMSWDETAVLVAIKGYEQYYDVLEGYFVVKEDGSNEWDENGEGHFHLVQRMAPADLQRILDVLIAHRPKSLRNN
jgi:inosine-uridine nucleoside N-ribohydrolase